MRKAVTDSESQLLVAFAGQAFLSLTLASWVFFLSKHGRLEVKHEEGSKEHKIERKRLELVTDILMIGNDIQMLTGQSLDFLMTRN
jgi:hypothetical protein